MPAEVGLYFLSGIVRILRLHALDEIGRLFSRHKPHVSLAPVAALALGTAHSLDLAADVEEPDFLDLHLEELFDRRLDLNLVRLRVAFHADSVAAGFAHPRRLLANVPGRDG